jgi:hypothetical protein
MNMRIRAPMNYWRSFRGSRLSTVRAISRYWTRVAVGRFQLWWIHSVTIDRASIAIGVRELRAEAVSEIGGSAVTEVESFVLLDQSPLEAMDGVALQKSFVLCGGEWPARATFRFHGDIWLWNAKRFEVCPRFAGGICVLG